MAEKPFYEVGHSSGKAVGWLSDTNLGETTDDRSAPPVILESHNTLSPRMVRWVKNCCIYRLNQKMLTEKQLFDALARKAREKFEGADADLCQQIARIGIEFCNEHGFLNDANFAEVKSGSGQRAGKSRRRIAMDLRKKGIESSLIQSSVASVDDWESAINFARKRAFGPFRKVELDLARKSKEYAAFCRSGFEPSIGAKIIDMSPADIEEAA